VTLPPPSRAVPVSAALLALAVGVLGLGYASRAAAPLGVRASLLVAEIALLAPTLLVVRARGLAPRDALALRAVSGRTLALSVLAGAAFWIASAGLVGVQAAVWPLPPEVLAFFDPLHAALAPEDAFAAAASLLAIAVAPGAVEEIVFRGSLLGSLRARTSAPVAVAASAALFASIHAVPAGYRVPFALAVGAGFGTLRLRTGSVLPGIVAHATLNTITIALPWMTGPLNATPETPIAQALAILAAGLVLSAWSLASMPRVDPERPSS
jgi:membrane protease YdiL (CAAX protease family)